MKAKVVSSSELFDKEKNPTLCLSPTRVFNDCHLCQIFRRNWIKEREEKLKCKPQLKPEKIELLKRKRSLLTELKELKKKLDTQDGQEEAED